MKIHLHIERVVLDGLPVSSAQAPSLKAAISAELGRLLKSDPPNSPHNEAVPYVRGADLAPRRGDSPPRLGTSIAASIHNGFAVLSSFAKKADL